MQKSFINLIEALKQQFNASCYVLYLFRAIKLKLVWFHHCAAELLVWGHQGNKLCSTLLVEFRTHCRDSGTVYRSSAAQRCLSYRPKQYSYAVLYFFRVRIPILTKKEIYKERKLRFPLIRHFSHWKIE